MHLTSLELHIPSSRGCFTMMGQTAVQHVKTPEATQLGNEMGLAHRLGVDQPQQNNGAEGTEGGNPEANLTGVSQSGASAHPGVMQQQVLGDDGVHNPHQGQRQGGDDSLLLCDDLQASTTTLQLVQELRQHRIATM